MTDSITEEDLALIKRIGAPLPTGEGVFELASFQASELARLLEAVRQDEREKRLNLGELRDVFERPFDGEDDPRIRLAQALTRSEAEAVLDHAGDLKAALLCSKGWKPIEGWVLVPRDPTPEMYALAWDALGPDEEGVTNLAAAWVAMIEAAPPTPSLEGGDFSSQSQPVLASNGQCEHGASVEGEG